MADAVGVAVNYLLVTGRVPCNATVFVTPEPYNSSGLFACVASASGSSGSGRPPSPPPSTTLGTTHVPRLCCPPPAPRPPLAPGE